MKIQHGTKPVRPDHRDFSWHRTFGAVGQENFTECNYDVGFPIANQNTDGLPLGCTGYTQSSIGQDQDDTRYVPRYTYDQTLAIEGIFPDSPQFEQVGCDIRASLKSTIVYGLQKAGDTPATALNYRRGQYFAIELVAGMDWFDSLRSAFAINKSSVSCASPFFPEWVTPVAGSGTAYPHVGADGILPMPVSPLAEASWHNHKISGWKIINGVPYLIDASWQGTECGDNGFIYFSRAVFNALMAIQGSGCFVLVPFTGANIQNVQLTLYETLLSYLRMWVAALKH